MKVNVDTRSHGKQCTGKFGEQNLNLATMQTNLAKIHTKYYYELLSERKIIYTFKDV